MVSTANADAVLAIARAHGVPARVIGTVQSASAGLVITVEGKSMRITAQRMSDAYHGALPRAMQKAAAEIVERDPALAGGTR